MKVNLMPMAGEGQRYLDAGYAIPKPLIDIDGMPMFVRAAKALPAADNYVFVCRESHIASYGVAQAIKEYFPGSIVVTAKELTEGQAMTCMLAHAALSAEASLTIGASDCDMIYDERNCQALFDDPDVDGWIWTFRRNPAVLQNPKMYGWVKTVSSEKAVYVSCKTPISDNPFEDHAVIGAFTFKKARYFFDAVSAMRTANDRINNEYYVDVAMNYAIDAGLRIQVFEVDRYICWGTPMDLKIYRYWRGYFGNRLYQG